MECKCCLNQSCKLLFLVLLSLCLLYCFNGNEEHLHRLVFYLCMFYISVSLNWIRYCKPPKISCLITISTPIRKREKEQRVGYFSYIRALPSGALKYIFGQNRDYYSSNVVKSHSHAVLYYISEIYKLLQ